MPFSFFETNNNHGNNSNNNSAGSSFDYTSLLPGSSGRGGSWSRAAPPSNQDDNVEDEDDTSIFSNLAFCPELGWKERLLGCGTCMVAGYLLSLGSFWRLVDLSQGDPFPFVVNATVGNMIALAGSCFLSGPAAQWRRMWHEKRQTATTLYLSTLVLTLLVALLPIPGPKAFYLIVLMLAQYVAVGWYCLSYIPFAHDFITNYLRRRLGGGGSSGSGGGGSGGSGSSIMTSDVI